VQLSARSLQIDRKIRYSLDPKTAIALKILREQVAGAMGARLRGKACTKAQGRWWELAMGCLTVGTHEDAPGVGLVTA
jgi:ATP-dependent RNA helicase DHX29